MRVTALARYLGAVASPVEVWAVDAMPLREFELVGVAIVLVGRRIVLGLNVYNWPISCDQVCCCGGVNTSLTIVAYCWRIWFWSSEFTLLPAARRKR